VGRHRRSAPPFGARLRPASGIATLWGRPAYRAERAAPKTHAGIGMEKVAVIVELFAFLRQRKAWWLMPVVVFLLVIALMIVMGESAALAPFIYPLF
jgi:hypothetical protein